MTSRVVDLADKIASAAHALNGAVDAPVGREREDLRNTILDAALELHDSLLTPPELLRTYATHAHLISLHFIHRFNIAQLVPASGAISFEELASNCGLSAGDVQRMLRHAATIRVFEEQPEGSIQHTDASRLLRDDAFHNWIGATCEDSWPAATKTVEALSLYPGSEEPTHSGFSLANDTSKTLYEIIAASPSRAARFAGGMRAHSSGQAFSPNHFVQGYASVLAALPPGATFVDIGGAHGHVSLALREAYPHLRYVVQDLPSVVASVQANGAAASQASAEVNGEGSAADKSAAAAAGGSLTFQAHDFFTPQLEAGASVYYLRWILHNWSDKYALAILRNLVPAMRQGSLLLIHDYCLEPLETLPMPERRLTTAMDIGMMQLLNARERNEVQWRELLRLADERFRWVGVRRFEGSALAVVEVQWSEDSSKEG